ncbi:hypothetical protein ACJRO7_026473 [Eucalyptus globulus]|uniref:Uncharacterized protein n=1 Tax=Eucalyptus globulus TaxID=34317 RepID=A0ABD3JNH1_EUCGL
MAPSLLQVRLHEATGDKTEIELLSCEVPKIRLLQSLSIQGSKGPQYSMQVLHFAMFPEPEYDLPIFCANFFTAAETIIVVLDLDPLYDVVKHKEYKDKCYEGLMSQLNTTWGGNLAGESLRFFSPIVIWTRLKSSQHMHDAWLVLMDLGIRETDASQIIANREAQHRYLTLRAEKNPGYEVLKRLLGETHAKIETSFTMAFICKHLSLVSSKLWMQYFDHCRDLGLFTREAKENMKLY